MQSSSPLSPQTRTGILKRFRTLYIFLAILFSGISSVVLAWYWNQPRNGNDGFSYTASLPILLVSSLLINSTSFYFQNRYLRRLLRRPQIAVEFSTVSFVLQFYLFNLMSAIALSLVGLAPLLYLLFLFWIYPIILWLIPYHLLMGLFISWELERYLRRRRLPQKKTTQAP
ncbi:MAG TPA: hypothetical protein V6D07_09655 [Trichocoleus sp.]